MCRIYEGSKFMRSFSNTSINRMTFMLKRVACMDNYQKKMIILMLLFFFLFLPLQRLSSCMYIRNVTSFLPSYSFGIIKFKGITILMWRYFSILTSSSSSSYIKYIHFNLFLFLFSFLYSFYFISSLLREEMNENKRVTWFI